MSIDHQRPRGDARDVSGVSSSEAHAGVLLRPSEVATRLSVSRSWVYAAAHDGRLPAIRLGGPDGPLRFDPDEIDAWLAQARQAWRPGESPRRHLRRLATSRD